MWTGKFFFLSTQFRWRWSGRSHRCPLCWPLPSAPEARLKGGGAGQALSRQGVARGTGSSRRLEGLVRFAGWCPPRGGSPAGACPRAHLPLGRWGGRPWAGPDYINAERRPARRAAGWWTACTAPARWGWRPKGSRTSTRTERRRACGSSTSGTPAAARPSTRPGYSGCCGSTTASGCSTWPAAPGEPGRGAAAGGGRGDLGQARPAASSGDPQPDGDGRRDRAGGRRGGGHPGCEGGVGTAGWGLRVGTAGRLAATRWPGFGARPAEALTGAGSGMAPQVWPWAVLTVNIRSIFDCATRCARSCPQVRV